MLKKEIPDAETTLMKKETRSRNGAKGRDTRSRNYGEHKQNMDNLDET